MEKRARGSCTYMCPKKEYFLRKNNKMIHSLEYGHGKSLHLVKQFSRSAAGQDHTRPEDLRVPSVCVETAEYLVGKILLRDCRQLSISTYEFVFDRLRSVRQDLAIQDVRDTHTIRVLEICVRFHLYSNYSLCHLDKSKFDPHMNFSHLLECLKLVLILYEENDWTEGAGEMTGIYLLVNLGSPSAINWCLDRRKSLRMNKLVKAGLRGNQLYLQRNFVALFKLIRNLPPLLHLSLHWNFGIIHREILLVMNSAFSSKILTYPKSHFGNLYDLSQQEISQLLGIYGIQEKNDAICFNKAVFSRDAMASPRQYSAITQRLNSCDLDELILKKL